MSEKIAVPEPTTSTPAPPNDTVDEIDRVLADFRSGWLSDIWPGFAGSVLLAAGPAAPTLAPARADVEETDDGFEIRADLPGIPKDQIDVRVHGDVVEIRGEQAVNSEAKTKNYLRQERSYRGFERSFRLPEPVLGDKVVARFENGTLTVTVPKAHPVEDRKVPVA